MKNIYPLNSTQYSVQQCPCLAFKKKTFIATCGKNFFSLAAKLCLFAGMALLLCSVIKIGLFASTIGFSAGPIVLVGLSVMGAIKVYRRIFVKGIENEKLCIVFGYQKLNKRAEYWERKTRDYIKINQMFEKIKGSSQYRTSSQACFEMDVEAIIDYFKMKLKSIEEEMSQKMSEIDCLKIQIEKMEKETSQVTEVESLKKEFSLKSEAFYRFIIENYLNNKLSEIYWLYIKQDFSRFSEDFFHFNVNILSYFDILERECWNSQKISVPFSSSVMIDLMVNDKIKDSMTLNTLLNYSSDEIAKKLLSC